MHITQQQDSVSLGQRGGSEEEGPKESLIQ